jgi:hypothetical protein
MQGKNVYLELEMSTGKMYQYSKTEQEGYVKVVGQNPQTKKEAVSYRKYYENGIVGDLKGLSVRETDHGKKLSVVLWNEVDDKMYFMSFPLFDQKKSISSFATSIIRYSPALELNTTYRFFPYVIEDEYKGKPQKKYGVSIKWGRVSDGAVDDVNKIPMLTMERTKTLEDGTKEVIPGDVPRTEWEEDITGGVTANTKKKDKYLWDTLNANLKEFTGGGSTKKTFNSKDPSDVQAEAPKQEEKKAESTPAVKPNPDFDTKPEKVTVADEEDEDDLPF